MNETPMMKQYQSFKIQYPDKVLLFRMGDFFETFGEDAKITSKVLNITLTTRDKKSDPTPLAGFPHHALEQYMPKLVNAGHSVVIVDQIEDPKLAKGIVKRAVTRIVTPSTLDDESKSIKNNYLMSLYKHGNEISISLLDLAIGDLKYCNIPYKKDHLYRVLQSFNPSEIVIMEHDNLFVFPELPISFVDKKSKKVSYAIENIQKFYNINSVSSLGIDEKEGIVNAISMSLDYVFETQKIKPVHIKKPMLINLKGYMHLDRSTVTNLELVSGLSSGSIKDSLFFTIDNCSTNMGKRLLYSWILKPLINKKEIEYRLDSVDKLFKNPSILDKTIDILSNINDIERILGKIGLNRVNARDLKALEISIDAGLKILDILSASRIIDKKEIVKYSELKNIYELISQSIIDNPPTSITEGHIIKEGYSKDVDEIRSVANNSKDWLKNFEQEQRNLTGINSLKVSFNKVFGYYIEITRANQDKVPSNYIRKQTLVNSERYITEELKEKEDIILNSADRLANIEYKVFQEIRDVILKSLTILQEFSLLLSFIDVVSGFAHLALSKSYCKPEIYEVGDKEGIIEIDEGRHPVVESISTSPFISNDTILDLKTHALNIITGPNMSGKSTYIRQVAVITLLAQIGCFVPAKSCKLSIVDRIFTRVGASDNLARGQSTFMVEMNEAANIINNATKYSLIILDEIGRGTSTYDGVSIAWSIAEYITNNIGARTLFATHYHELLKLNERYPDKIQNYNVLVDEDTNTGDVIFLRKIVKGGTDRSYGIYVAKMAGLPLPIIERANEILEGFEQQSLFESDTTIRGAGIDLVKSEKRKVPSTQISLFSNENNEIINILKDIDLDNLTPLDALNIIAKLKKNI